MSKQWSPDGISCGQCKCWFGGQCRRHPPQLVLWPTDNQHPITYMPVESWPTTMADDWCGDFQRNGEPHA